MNSWYQCSGLSTLKCIILRLYGNGRRSVIWSPYSRMKELMTSTVWSLLEKSQGLLASNLPCWVKQVAFDLTGRLDIKLPFSWIGKFRWNAIITQWSPGTQSKLADYVMLSDVILSVFMFSYICKKYAVMCLCDGKGNFMSDSLLVEP